MGAGKDLVQRLGRDLNILTEVYRKLLVKAVDNKIKQVLFLYHAVCLGRFYTLSKQTLPLTRCDRLKLLHPDFREIDETVPVAADASALAHRYATQQRFRKLAVKLEDHEQAVTVETLHERTTEDIIREEHKRLYYGANTVDMETFRSEVAALTRTFLDER